MSEYRISPKDRKSLYRSSGTCPTVHVGKAGLSDGAVAAVRDSLRMHELIRVRAERSLVEEHADWSNRLVELLNLPRLMALRRVGRTVLLFHEPDVKAEERIYPVRLAVAE